MCVHVWLGQPHNKEFLFPGSPLVRKRETLWRKWRQGKGSKRRERLAETADELGEREREREPGRGMALIFLPVNPSGGEIEIWISSDQLCDLLPLQAFCMRLRMASTQVPDPVNGAESA